LCEYFVRAKSTLRFFGAAVSEFHSQKQLLGLLQKPHGQSKC